MRTVAVAAALLWISSAAGQAAPSIPRASESIEVSIVNVDCVVTDKSGARVHHLTADDFVVLEDGQPQKLTNFAEYAETPNAAPAPATAANAPAREARPVRRTVIIFADDIHAASFVTDPIFGAFNRMLAEAIRPGDAVLVATFRNELEIRQDFTDNLGAVQHALERIAKESSGVTIDREAQLRDERRQMQDFVSQSADFAREKNFVTPSASMTAPERGGSGIEQAYFELDRTQRKVAALKQLIGTIAAAEGRKMLVLLTSHFGRVAGFEYFANVGGPQDSYYERIFNTRELMASLTETANAYGVTIYTAYPAATPGSSASDASVSGTPDPLSNASPAFEQLILADRLYAMKRVSGDTGGTTAVGPKDIIGLLSRVRDDFGTYYSLAYRQTSHAAKPRRIEVRTKNPAYTVRMRRNAVEKPLVERVADQVSASLVRSPAAAAIPVTISLGERVKKSRNSWVQPVSVTFPASSLTLLPAARTRRGAFTVFVEMSRAVGQPPKETRKTIEIDENQVRHAPGGIFTYDFDLLADQYTRRVSVGIFDEVSGELGIAAQDLGGVK